jgi:hypothetical protein
MGNKTVILVVICCALWACRFNPNIQGKGDPIVQGVWEEDSVQYQNQLVEYTKHKFTFTCDSFYVTFSTRSSVERNADSCFNGGVWKEYAKGVYALRNDTLYLDGTFTKANFKQKVSGCYRIGQYKPVFILKKHTGQNLVFQDEHVSLNLSLKQMITCVPKPL